MTDSANTNNRNLPGVSLIIPYRDNQEELVNLWKALLRQTYPADHIEIICIDNGSERNFSFPDAFLEKVILLTENDYPNSPYSARNRGIETASSEVIAFIDANSRPEEKWLQKGIECLMDSGCDLTGGAVSFDFGDKPTAAKRVDALRSINMKKAIEERAAAYTANLFVKRELFDVVGLFEEGVRSGGDVRFTLKVKEAGYSICYCPSAVVWKKARSAKQLYRKKIRTGRGYFYSWSKEENRSLWFYNFFRSLKPPAFRQINRQYAERYGEDLKDGKMATWFHYYASGIAEQVSFMTEYLRYNLSSQRDIDRRKKRMEENSLQGEKKDEN